MNELREIEKKITLSPIQRILLVTDGSITKVLEALTGDKVSVKTQKQKLVKADKTIAKALDIAVGDEVNFRVVNLVNSSGVLMHAISYTALKRLKKDFRDDIMKADIPIGRIMYRLKIEARREIKEIVVIKADERLSSIFDVKKGAILLKRNYNIIHNEDILLNITEIFPYERFR